MKRALVVGPGKRFPLGATPDEHGVNFSVYSENATAVSLLLFEAGDEAAPVLEVQLDPVEHKTFHFWHAYVGGAVAGMRYALRADGPGDRMAGHHFDRQKVLIDPYARAVSNRLWGREHACRPGDNLGTSLRGVVVAQSRYDWEGDRPLARPLADSVIYEVHVRGFTQSRSSGVSQPGTFRGLIEKIPYFKELGITAVELMPVFEFDHKSSMEGTMGDGSPRRNYWGYGVVSFFAPASRYCSSPDPARHADEFRDLVKALHRAGIEVILDVVYNHTDEGDHLGPVFSFKGIDNRVYYHLRPGDPLKYADFSGCGNTLNCNHPVMQRLIRDSLEFWVEEMHVDGFRFDEGSILSRGEDGEPMKHPPALWDIELDEAFADTKLIAEAWDAAGLYQVGRFPGYRWAEWNGRFRDTVRRFVCGEPGIVGEVASRIAGSQDLYGPSARLPSNSINFVAAHDGFTLADLVSYNEKHNWANGERNRDGLTDNFSWNCGAEGDTADPGVLALRRRQVRNLAAILFLSQGVPMLQAGDEVGRTQRGNNNAYCQDNEISWLDWCLKESSRDLFRFFRNLIAFRRAHRALRRTRFLEGRPVARGFLDVAWHGCRLGAPGWHDPGCRVLAFTLGALSEEEQEIHVLLNMSGESLPFELPVLPGARAWARFLDTALPPPDDVTEPGAEVRVGQGTYVAGQHSTVVLVAK